MESEAAPAVEVVNWKANGGELIADRRVEARVHLFGYAGNHKQHGAAHPCAGREPRDSERDLQQSGSRRIGQGLAPVV